MGRSLAGPYFRPMRHSPWWIVLTVLAGLCLSTQAHAFHIRLYGLVTDHFTGDGMKGVQVRLVKDSIDRETVITASNGKYEMFLERGYDYLVWFHRDDLVTKHVRIDARDIPLFPDVPFYEMDVQMTMIPWIEGFDFEAFDMPVGMAAYKHSVRNLNWDIAYTERRRPILAKVMVQYERALIRMRREKEKDRGAPGARQRKPAEF